MKGKLRLIAAATMLVFAGTVCAEVSLNGKDMTPEAVARVASGESVAVTSSAMHRVRQANQVLLKAASEGQMIYGLTVGVGWNKDRKMVDASGQLTPEIIEASRRFNIGLIHAHCGGVGPDLPVTEARAAMAVRLNDLLAGGGGVQPDIVDHYVQLLNHGITPAIPNDGSIGEADITLLSHVGLAMMGEGDVYYHGNKVAAAEALRAEGIAPIQPYGKDALSILSSNAFSAGQAALALNDMARLAHVQKLVYALSLEAMNGNVSPFLADTLALHPFPETERAGAELRKILDGSSLWQKDAERPLQDPLSFRDSVYMIGELDRSLDEARALMHVQLNSSDDNPGVAVGVSPASSRDQESRGYLKSGPGAVLPSANFEPLPWVLALEQVQVALAHNALASAQRVIKLNDPARSGLSRFLGTEDTVHAFGAMEKPLTILAMREKELAMPASMDYLPVAGGIEDVATNAPLVVERLRQQIDYGYQLLGIEMIHAAQAIDLRQQKQKGFTLSTPTQNLYDALRQQVKFLQTDRPMTPDFRAAADLLRQYPM